MFAELFVSLHPKNNKTKEIMPEISKFYGIIIYMYIDDHNPPHFHVWYDDYQAEITRTASCEVKCRVAPCDWSMSGSTCTATN